MEDIEIVSYIIISSISAPIDTIGGGGGGGGGGSSRNILSLPEVPTLTISLYCKQQI